MTVVSQAAGEDLRLTRFRKLVFRWKFLIPPPPTGSWFRALGAVTRVAFDAGVSSHFCLLAFINRRFREKFITEILCGTFKLHKVVDKLRR